MCKTTPQGEGYITCYLGNITSFALLPSPSPSPSSPPLTLSLTFLSSSQSPLLLPSPSPLAFLSSSPQSALLLPSPSFPLLPHLSLPSLSSLSPSCSRVSATTTSTITSLRPRKKVLTKHKSKLPRVSVCHCTHPCCYYALPVILTLSSWMLLSNQTFELDNMAVSCQE